MRSLPQRGRGFVLALTLWVLAAIAIVATFVAERSQAAVHSAGEQLREADAMVSMSDARNEILYRFATVPMTNFGLGAGDTAIRMDDHVYAYDDRVTLQIQDARGLVNVNRASDEELTRLLRLYNVPVEQQPGLLDKLRDYVDQDDFIRLNGAEKDQYLEAGLPPPRNAELVTPEELVRVLGWRDLPEVVNHRLIDQLSTKGAGFNPNTATRDLLLTLPGMTLAGAEAVLAQRELQPFMGPADLAAAAQMPPGSFAMLAMPFPADSFRLTLATKQVNWMLRYNVTLTPFDAKAPWQIDYALRLPRPVPVAIPVAAASAPESEAAGKTPPPPPPPTPLPPRVDVPIDYSPPLPTSH